MHQECIRCASGIFQQRFKNGSRVKFLIRGNLRRPCAVRVGGPMAKDGKVVPFKVAHKHYPGAENNPESSPSPTTGKYRSYGRASCAPLSFRFQLLLCQLEHLWVLAVKVRTPYPTEHTKPHSGHSF